jgi:circadian clock protein KaiC
MEDRMISTGSEGLDRLLRGGLRRAGLHVVIGPPGVGKSVLAHQIGAHHIRAGGRVLYLTALSESHQTLLAQARTFRFFDPATVSHAFYYASLYPALERDGLAGVTEELRRLLREHEPSLLVIDSIQALRLLGSSELEYLRWLHGLEAQAAVSGTTTLLLAHPLGRGPVDPTLTIADGIIALKTVAQQLRTVRLVSVVKMRSVDHITGWHTARLTPDGWAVYPRLEAIVATEGLPPEMPQLVRFKFAAEGLHEMMGGGVAGSSATFIMGTPGSGKTFLGLAFVCGGLAEGQRALHFSFHETPDRLLMKADEIGLPLRRGVEQGLITVHWEPPSEILSDEIAGRILEEADAHGTRRVFLDGYDQFKRGAVVGDRHADFFSAFCDLLRTRGVAVVLSADMPRIAGESVDLPIGELSPVVDNIIYVRSTELHAKFRRMIAILKVREQPYDTSIREFTIGAAGIRIGDVFREGEALLTGVPKLEGPRQKK